MRNDHSIHWTWLPSAEYVVSFSFPELVMGSARRVLGTTIVAVAFAIGYAGIAGPHDSLPSRG